MNWFISFSCNVNRSSFSLRIVFIAVQPYFNYPYHILHYTEQYSGCQIKHFETEIWEDGFCFNLSFASFYFLHYVIITYLYKPHSIFSEVFMFLPMFWIDCIRQTGSYWVIHMHHPAIGLDDAYTLFTI